MVHIDHILDKLSMKAQEILGKENYYLKVPNEFRKGCEWIRGKILCRETKVIRFRDHVIDIEKLSEEQLVAIKEL